MARFMRRRSLLCYHIGNSEVIRLIAWRTCSDKDIDGWLQSHSSTVVSVCEALTIIE